MFSEDTVDFLGALRAHNTREWFEDHRAAYQAAVRDPARDFAESLSRLLDPSGLGPVTAKIFRINRDLRFSRDKTPYNTHVHMAFVPAGSGADGPAWMVGLEPGRLTLGAGIMAFTPRQTERWRDGVAGPAGEALQRELDALIGQGCSLTDPELARVPRPFAGDHPRADLLRRKGFVVWWHSAETRIAYGRDGPARCHERLAAWGPVMTWLSETMRATR